MLMRLSCDDIDMTPEGAAALAQIDATLLVALVVQTTTGERNRNEPQSADDRSTIPWLSLAGLLGAALSLNIALASVMYDKPLDGTGTTLAMLGQLLGILPLFMPTVGRLLSGFDNIRARDVIYGLVALVLVVWVFVWQATFRP
jgi:hypothetical protein